MAVEIISGSISTKVWDWARIKLATPGSAVRNVTDCALLPGHECMNSISNVKVHFKTHSINVNMIYSKPCLKRPFKKRQTKGLKDKC